MRLATISDGSGARAAVAVADGTFVHADALVADAPGDVLSIIEAGAPLWSRLADAASGARGGVAAPVFLAPVPQPRRNVMCVGWNYSEHFEEGRATRGADALERIPDHPALFTKNPATVIGHDQPVAHPAPYSEQLDWEVELAVVIGRAGRDIAEADAMGFVFGYTIGNDVSVRDVQRQWHGGQWFKGKNFDGHLPLGPWIVTADEIPDPQALRITSRVNGVTKQDSNTTHMVFTIRRIISELSAGMALQAGDIIMTGTPAGVGMGRTPPEWLVPGDVMEMEIERIGVLRNRVERGSERWART
ncbi:MAG TPA: fumarylacetoacetate hydrolase family protein [Candidatus Limnocylindria bacterium]